MFSTCRHAIYFFVFYFSFTIFFCLKHRAKLEKASKIRFVYLLHDNMLWCLRAQIIVLFHFNSQIVARLIFYKRLDRRKMLTSSKTGSMQLQLLQCLQREKHYDKKHPDHWKNISQKFLSLHCMTSFTGAISSLSMC